MGQYFSIDKYGPSFEARHALYQKEVEKLVEDANITDIQIAWTRQADWLGRFKCDVWLNVDELPDEWIAKGMTLKGPSVPWRQC